MMFIAYAPTLYLETSLTWWIFGIIAYFIVLITMHIILSGDSEGLHEDASDLIFQPNYNNTSVELGDGVVLILPSIIFGLLNFIYWIF